MTFRLALAILVTAASCHGPSHPTTPPAPSYPPLVARSGDMPCVALTDGPTSDTELAACASVCDHGNGWACTIEGYYFTHFSRARGLPYFKDACAKHDPDGCAELASYALDYKADGRDVHLALLRAACLKFNVLQACQQGSQKHDAGHDTELDTAACALKDESSCWALANMYEAASDWDGACKVGRDSACKKAEEIKTANAEEAARRAARIAYEATPEGKAELAAKAAEETARANYVSPEQIAKNQRENAEYAARVKVEAERTAAREAAARARAAAFKPQVPGRKYKSMRHGRMSLEIPDTWHSSTPEQTAGGDGTCWINPEYTATLCMESGDSKGRTLEQMMTQVLQPISGAIKSRDHTEYFADGHGINVHVTLEKEPGNPIQLTISIGIADNEYEIVSGGFNADNPAMRALVNERVKSVRYEEAAAK